MKVEEVQPLIKNWMPKDRPREKLESNGKSSLTEAELLSIILGTGTRGQNSLNISRKMLEVAGNDLNVLADLPIGELTAIRGIGKAQAIKIMACMELALRRKEPTEQQLPKITSSHEAFMHLQPCLSNLSHEEFWVLLLNRRSRLVLKKQISSGGLSSTVVDPRIIFKHACDHKASSIILAHNHPSGSLTPSQSDIDLTNKLVAAGKFMDIQVVDHLILAGKNYCSFADSGLL